MRQKLKPKKPNIATKVISKPKITTVVKTHSEQNTVVTKANNQMAILQVQVGKNIVEDVLLDGGASVNIIIKNS